MLGNGKYFNPGSLTVILVTFVLFAVSLFVEGLTHDVLLEAGVLLVSIKLMLMSYTLTVSERSLHVKLNTICTELTQAGVCRPSRPRHVE